MNGKVIAKASDINGDTVLGISTNLQNAGFIDRILLVRSLMCSLLADELELKLFDICLDQDIWPDDKSTLDCLKEVNYLREVEELKYKTNNDITTELLPCPFCGGKAILNIIPPHTHTIATFMPDCEGEAFIECTCILAGRTAEEVIEAWNRR